MPDHEAGWGFVAEKESLVIYASILPCTVALEFDDSAPDGAVLRSKHCYEDAAAKIESHTGERISRFHNDVNLLRWSIHAPECIPRLQIRATGALRSVHRCRT